MGQARRVIIALTAGLGALLAGAAAHADDDHRHGGRKDGYGYGYGYERPGRGHGRGPVTDHLGRPVDPRYYQKYGEDRRWRSPPPSAWEDGYAYDRYGYDSRFPTPRIVVPVGGYFQPDFAYAYRHRYGPAYRVYGDYRGRWSRPYRVGYPPPRGVVCAPLHRSWLAVLPPAPYGHRYVQVDRDVLLIAEATNRIVDAIVLLSAVD